MDLPLGGLGNPTPQHRAGNLLVGPAGVPYHSKLDRKKQPNYVNAIQHGHLYVRRDLFTGRTHTSASFKRSATQSFANATFAATTTTSSVAASSSMAGSQGLLDQDDAVQQTETEGTASHREATQKSNRVNTLLIGIESS